MRRENASESEREKAAEPGRARSGRGDKNTACSWGDTWAAGSSGAILRSISQGSAGFAGMQPDNELFFFLTRTRRFIHKQRWEAAPLFLDGVGHVTIAS